MGKSKYQNKVYLLPKELDEKVAAPRPAGRQAHQALEGAGRLHWRQGGGPVQAGHLPLLSAPPMATRRTTPRSRSTFGSFVTGDIGRVSGPACVCTPVARKEWRVSLRRCGTAREGLRDPFCVVPCRTGTF